MHPVRFMCLADSSTELYWTLLLYVGSLLLCSRPGVSGGPALKGLAVPYSPTCAACQGAALLPFCSTRYMHSTSKDAAEDFFESLSLCHGQAMIAGPWEDFTEYSRVARSAKKNVHDSNFLLGAHWPLHRPGGQKAWALCLTQLSAVNSPRLVQAWGADHKAGTLHHWLQDAERDQVCCRRSEGPAQLSDAASKYLDISYTSTLYIVFRYNILTYDHLRYDVFNIHIY